LEDLILELVRNHRGLKETDLWVLVMATMNRTSSGGRECIASALIVGTIHWMIRHGDLVGINLTAAADRSTPVLQNSLFWLTLSSLVSVWVVGGTIIRRLNLLH